MANLHHTQTITAGDHTKLYLQSGQPNGPVKANVFVVHGYAEHGDRYEELASTLIQHHLQVFVADLRGHGRSGGRRGHIRDFEQYLSDISTICESLPTDKPTFFLGHSLGGLIALDYVFSRRPRLNGLILSNPFLELAMQVPWLKQKAADFFGKVWPTLSISSGLDSAGLSHDTEICKKYDDDPMIFKTVTAGWVRETKSTQARVLAQTQIDFPLLYIYSDADPIACPNTNQNFSERLKSSNKTVELRKNEYHEVLNEVDRLDLHQRIANWMRLNS